MLLLLLLLLLRGQGAYGGLIQTIYYSGSKTHNHVAKTAKQCVLLLDHTTSLGFQNTATRLCFKTQQGLQPI
jgi:hypothetical protein